MQQPSWSVLFWLEGENLSAFFKPKSLFYDTSKFISSPIYNATSNIYSQRAIVATVYLEPVHLPTADIVINSAPKYVHGFPYDSCSMKQPTRRNLWVMTWSHYRPCLCVKVIAVQVIWQSAVSCPSKYIQVAIKCHHGVAIATCRWGWGTT